MRAFRHTATLAGLSVIKGLIAAAIDLKSDLEVASKRVRRTTRMGGVMGERG